MEAYEARCASILPQYNKMLEEIMKNASKGNDSYWENNGYMFPEVAQLLAKDGFDVIIEKYYFEVSWRNAEKGRVGTITENGKEIDLIDISIPGDFGELEEYSGPKKE